MQKIPLPTRFACLFALVMLCGFSSSAQSDIQLTDDPTLGQILVDANGNTLYYFTKDSEPNASACTGGCLNAWPVFYVSEPAAGAGLDAADFGNFQRADGAMQTTYKGWPLYYYAGDGEAGDTNGEGVNNIWFVGKPDYGIMLMNDILVGLDEVTYNSNYEAGTEEVQYFVDAQGRTLYVFINDFFDQNNFTREDFSNNPVWPIYEEDLGSIPSTLDATLFNTIDVFGRQQLTYKGWPLYYFGQDSERGETKGVSVPQPGVWPVTVPDIEAALLSDVQDIEALTGLNVFPNPFSQSVNLQLKLETQTPLTIGLYNPIGQLVQPVLRENFPSGNSTVSIGDLGDLPKGIYFLKLQSNTGGLTTVRILR